jgi:hypothetical protein
MAAPQFSTPSAKPAPRKKNSFTLRQANRALPLVSRVVRDIVNTHERATQLQAKLESTTNGKETGAVKEQLDHSLERLQEYVDELTSIGVELKDYETGLIDFPGRHQGRDVYLCWRLGEENVGHWHELHTGVSGRQSTASLEEGD